jgi:hypothetical protein
MKRFIRYLDVYVRYRYDSPQHISFTQTVTFLHSLGRIQTFG